MPRSGKCNQTSDLILCELAALRKSLRIALEEIAHRQQVKPDDHSEAVPLLPIPNRTVKRLCANDSADSRVKVGHRQANILDTPGVFRVFVSSQRRPICAARRGWMSRLGIQH